jgi:hypothetical protein
MGFSAWLDDRIAKICAERSRVRGCDINGWAKPVPYETVTKVDFLSVVELEPGPPFGNLGGGYIKIPEQLGGRHIMCGRIDWTKSDPQTPWYASNADQGFLLSYAVQNGDPLQLLPNSRLTATPVVHARHTFQSFVWEGILDAGDTIEFYVRQTVLQGEALPADGGLAPTPVDVQVALNLAVRRPGHQY